MRSAKQKLVALDDIVNISNRPMVLCYGSFDVIHPGHIRYLSYARNLGSCLVVAVTADAGGSTPTSSDPPPLN